MAVSTPAKPAGFRLGPCHQVTIPTHPFPVISHDIKQRKGRDSQMPTSGGQVGTEASDFSLLTVFLLYFVAQMRMMMGK